jgi:hypothetical protein
LPLSPCTVEKAKIPYQKPVTQKYSTEHKTRRILAAANTDQKQRDATQSDGTTE